MANLMDGVVAALAGESTVSALVGTRVWADNAPPSPTFPFIVCTQLDRDFFNTLDGGYSMTMETYDIDCCSDRSVEAATLVDAVQVFMDDFTGATGAAGVTIAECLTLSQSSTPVQPVSGGELLFYIRNLTLGIFWSP